MPETSASGAGLGLLTGAGTSFALDRMLAPAFRTAGSKAKTVLSRYMRDVFPDEQTAQAAARAVGPEGSLIDMSRGTRQIGQTFAASSPRFAQRVETDLLNRSEGAANRIIRTVQKAWGAKGKIKGTPLESVLKDEAERAGVLYRTAFQKTVPNQKLDVFLQQIDDYAARFENIPKATPALRQLRKSLFKTSFKGNKEIKIAKQSVEELHFARKAFGDAIHDMRKTSPQIANELKPLRDAFDDVMPEEYLKANSLWSGKKSFETAVADGRKVLRTDVDIIEDDLARMSQADKKGYLIGAARAIDDMVNASQESAKKTGQLNKRLIQDRLRPLFPDDESFKVFMDRVGHENTYNLTKNAILSGSATQEREASKAIVDQIMSKEGIDLARSSYARKGIEWVMGKKQTGALPPKLADDLADILLDKGKVTPEFINALMKTPHKAQIEQFINEVIGPASVMTAGAAAR